MSVIAQINGGKSAMSALGGMLPPAAADLKTIQCPWSTRNDKLHSQGSLDGWKSVLGLEQVWRESTEPRTPDKPLQGPALMPGRPCRAAGARRPWPDCTSQPGACLPATSGPQLHCLPQPAKASKQGCQTEPQQVWHPLELTMHMMCQLNLQVTVDREANYMLATSHATKQLASCDNNGCSNDKPCLHRQ